MSTRAPPPDRTDDPAPRVRDALRRTASIGPLLFCRGWRAGRLQLAALMVRPADAPDRPLRARDADVAPELLHQRLGYRVLRYRFALDAAPDAGYRLDGTLLGDYLFERYLESYSQGPMSRLMSTVPSLAIWDDHDICDGWGSRPAGQLDSPVGRLIFRVAREQFLLFQMGSTAEALPEICADPGGATLSWGVRLPGVRLLAPDLRSERRPNRVLGSHGRRALQTMLADVGEEQVFVLSSVPLLGPRLSWVEAILGLIPHAQKYEDDLRDQWQSRAHRHEWRATLETVLGVHRPPASRVAVLSGEIHLATRGTMASAGGPIHQLVSSGIAHPPPPRLYAALLGGLARVGETPLPDHPIRLWPLPGHRQIYTAQRNYLMLERRAGDWYGWWELEDDGPTPSLPLV